jgi:hypothetical protein
MLTDESCRFLRGGTVCDGCWKKGRSLASSRRAGRALSWPVVLDPSPRCPHRISNATVLLTSCALEPPAVYTCPHFNTRNPREGLSLHLGPGAMENRRPYREEAR